MTEFELERQAEITKAQLEVARNFSISISVLTVVLAASFSLTAWSWPPLALGAYYGCTFRYRRSADAAEDRYHRVARLGRYSSTGS